MEIIFTLIICSALFTACQQRVDKEKIKHEIFQTEKAFEKMAAEKSVPEAFYYFADDSAVIKRQNDTLIVGKENIKRFYEKNRREGAKVSWTPDFIDIADDGTLGYTYGKFSWKIKNEKGEVNEYKGVFHTVWKKQKDNTWKYVWD